MGTQSRSHFGQSHYEVAKLGEGEFGETHLAIERTIAENLYAKLRKSDKAKFYDELRSQLIVVKFYKETQHCWPTGYATHDLKNEIEVLTKSLPTKHPRIVEVVDYHLDGKTQWLTTRYTIGGDVRNFTDKYPNDVSISFVWHIGYQLAEALMFLLFGITETDSMIPKVDWPCLYHGDVQLGNILLQPSNAVSSFANYPDLILADFGEANCFTTCNATSTRVQLQQIRDVEQFGVVLEELLELATSTQDAGEDVLLRKWIRGFGNISIMRPTKGGVRHLYCLLGKFMEAADKGRKADVRPLSVAAVAGVASSKVSDGELEVMFCRSTGYSKVKKNKRR